MEQLDFAARLRSVRARAPLVQCITNFVTVNDCANIILAAGGSPTMSHDVREVEEAVAGVQALVCNLGAIGDLEAMLLAGKRANALGIPVVLDPVAGALPSSGATPRRSGPWPWARGAAAGWTWPPGTRLPRAPSPPRRS